MINNHGFLLINKPAGITSHDVVDQVRKITSERKVGHAGTLDPFATGLLIIGVGKPATKKLSEFVGLPKVYEATFILGATSDTDDCDGQITPQEVSAWPEKKTVEEAMKKYLGQIQQIPPQYAAIKIKGKKMYELARAGQEIKAKPRDVEIFAYDLLEYDPPKLRCRINCSSGTYIRALARDLGEDLGTGAYVDELKRTQIGEHKLEDATTLDHLDEKNWQDKILKI